MWKNINKNSFLYIRIGVIVIIDSISLVFVIPLGYFKNTIFDLNLLRILIFVQIKNFLMNKTTSERFGYNSNKNQELRNSTVLFIFNVVN